MRAVHVTYGCSIQVQVVCKLFCSFYARKAKKTEDFQKPKSTGHFGMVGRRLMTVLYAINSASSSGGHTPGGPGERMARVVWLSTAVMWLQSQYIKQHRKVHTAQGQKEPKFKVHSSFDETPAEVVRPSTLH